MLVNKGKETANQGLVAEAIENKGWKQTKQFHKIELLVDTQKRITHTYKIVVDDG